MNIVDIPVVILGQIAEIFRERVTHQEQYFIMVLPLIYAVGIEHIVRVDGKAVLKPGKRREIAAVIFGGDGKTGDISGNPIAVNFLKDFLQSHVGAIIVPVGVCPVIGRIVLLCLQQSISQIQIGQSSILFHVFAELLPSRYLVQSNDGVRHVFAVNDFFVGDRHDIERNAALCRLAVIRKSSSSEK